MTTKCPYSVKRSLAKSPHPRYLSRRLWLERRKCSRSKLHTLLCNITTNQLWQIIHTSTCTGIIQVYASICQRTTRQQSLIHWHLDKFQLSSTESIECSHVESGQIFCKDLWHTKLLLLRFYGHYAGQPGLTRTVFKNSRIPVEQSFIACIPILKATSLPALSLYHTHSILKVDEKYETYRNTELTTIAVEMYGCCDNSLGANQCWSFPSNNLVIGNAQLLNEIFQVRQLWNQQSVTWLQSVIQITSGF